MFHQFYSQRRKKIAALLMFIIINEYNEKRTFRKRIWVKPWIGRRKEQDIYNNLFTELLLEDQDKFRRHSRARRTCENTFGILGAKFQIFRSPMRYDPDIAVLLIQTCCCLHNFLCSNVIGRALYTPDNMLETQQI
ncbi:hypothetical protein ALC62_13653 [Cyphomyrmex costatus]|uniref:DDE Tnp4 domain-containing protein n=1 Tax=Cyphomyrmex costatus TaxID=456900 RepID=A0A151I9Z3_9HYME|nr:hypothetical protein ALC62_13653 [Cyphomyrmex costatus]